MRRMLDHTGRRTFERFRTDKHQLALFFIAFGLLVLWVFGFPYPFSLFYP